MQLPIPAKVKKFWDVWNLRVCILISLSLQAFLVMFASSRQRFRKAFLLFLIWGAYLLADWIAAVAIGLTTKGQDNDKSRNDDHTKGAYNQDISAFWASFLLLHLGGPDSITSFALEDNEFWVRHLFGLFLQAVAAAYSFYLTLPKNKLWPPTVLVFLVGIVKYAERTRALYLASLDRFGATVLPKPEPGPDYEETSTTYASRLIQVPIQAEMTAISSTSTAAGSSYDPDFDVEKINLEASNELNILQVAYKLFERFKGLIVGFFLSTKDRLLSRNLFLKITDYRCAFRLIENELSFMFNVLHTKVVVTRSRFGYALRGLSFCSLVGASMYFIHVEKKEFGRLELILTYALLSGAIVLDVISIIFKLFLSDMTLIVVQNSWTKYVPERFLKRTKWSNSVFQYNMIDYCLDESPKWLYKFARLIDVSGTLDKIKIMWFSSSDKVTEDLKKFIFDELKDKSDKAASLRDAVKASQQRGNYALSRCSNFATEIKLKWSIGEFQYTESLLLWHIATEICYLKMESSSSSSSSGENIASQRKHCKILSDYMFYLLIKHPNMMSTILGNWYVVFQDTSAEAKRFFIKHSIKDCSKALEKIISMKAKFRPAAVKGTKSKSVFFDACILAQQLQGLGDDRWEIMDRMWVELMCYAAVNCRPIIHAQQPSKGGELFTFTWLLMAHFGLGIQFSEQEEQAGTKMVAVK
ncbi:hypothetical protein TIFTF001_022717 [Ficus carica]|uniref:DUF4220 domain-containing protein n=1 Tax=Ficus carica TaxID=3494 RepID=A0AA88AJ50_FICCA|nr:hypothetical protein TIFTF001_022717 [Ficus carica]